MVLLNICLDLVTTRVVKNEDFTMTTILLFKQIARTREVKHYCGIIVRIRLLDDLEK